MSDPMDRLSGADPELGRAVPPTPVFAATEATPLFAGPLRAVLIAAAVVLLIGIPAWLLGRDSGGGDVVAPPDPTTTTVVDPTTTVPATSTTAPEPTTTTTPAEWEGEPFDFWVPIPDEGPILGVVGVPYDDTLNVRSGPGVDFEIIGELGPLNVGMTGTGRGWQLAEGDVWWEIETGTVTGWVNQRYVTRIGQASDLTAQVLEVGPIVPMPGMQELAMVVATRLVGEEGEWVVVAEPTYGDLGEITMDIVGIGDDSVAGLRLHVFGQSEDGGESWGLKAVEVITFCQRGFDGEFCV